MTGYVIERTRGVSHYEDFEILLDGRQCRERDADLGHNAGDDELLPPVAFTAFTNSPLSQALIWPGLCTEHREGL
jgi:hypothetical protein